MGTYYSFSIEARNSHGYSNATEPFPILCAVKPLIPTDITTVNANENVLVQWVAPYDSGESIDAYRIMILTQEEDVFAEEMFACDGTDPQIVLDANCYIP